MKTHQSFLAQLFKLTGHRRRSSRLEVIKASLTFTAFQCPVCGTPASDAYANFCSRCGAAFMPSPSKLEPLFNQQPTTGPSRNERLFFQAARVLRPAGLHTEHLRAVRWQKDYYPLLDQPVLGRADNKRK